MRFEVLEQVFVLVGVICIGVLTRRARVFGDEAVQGMSSLLAKVTNPLLLIGSTAALQSGDELARAWNFLILSLVFHFAVCLLMYGLGKLLHLESSMRRVFAMLIGFGNVGFIGYPIAFSLYGELGLVYAIPVAAGFQLTFWTVGTIIFGGIKGFRPKNLLAPGTLASLYVLLCMAFPVLRLPSIFTEISKSVGNITVPLALLLVGAMLARADFLAVIKSPLPYVISFLKLLVIPICTFFILRLLQFDQTTVVLFSLLMGCPTGSLVPILAAVQDCQPEYAAAVTSLNTLLFLMTLPLLLALFL